MVILWAKRKCMGFCRTTESLNIFDIWCLLTLNCIYIYFTLSVNRWNQGYATVLCNSIFISNIQFYLNRCLLCFPADVVATTTAVLSVAVALNDATTAKSSILTFPIAHLVSRLCGCLIVKLSAIPFEYPEIPPHIVDRAARTAHPGWTTKTSNLCPKQLNFSIQRV